MGHDDDDDSFHDHDWNWPLRFNSSDISMQPDWDYWRIATDHSVACCLSSTRLIKIITMINIRGHDRMRHDALCNEAMRPASKITNNYDKNVRVDSKTFWQSTNLTNCLRLTGLLLQTSISGEIWCNYFDYSTIKTAISIALWILIVRTLIKERI